MIMYYLVLYLVFARFGSHENMNKNIRRNTHINKQEVIIRLLLVEKGKSKQEIFPANTSLSMVGGFLCYFIRPAAFVWRGNEIPEGHTISSRGRK